jgi:Nanos RNA binding domain
MSSSSSYSSASSRASNAYNKSVLPFCKVCYDAGMPVADYTDHFVKDQPGPNGKVVCPTLLAQKCLNCGVPGHTTNYCPEKLHGERDRSERDREERERAKKSVAAGQSWETVGQKSASSFSSIKPRPRIEDMDANTKTKPKSATRVITTTPRKTYGGSFGVLCIDDLSSDDECEQAEMQNTPAGAPQPVHTQRPILTGPPSAVEPVKPLTWAQRAAATAAQKASPPYSSAPRPAATHLTDTRFQLHALCERVEMDKRAIVVPKRAAAAAVAVAIATENSRKRKQESSMVPA